MRGSTAVTPKRFLLGLSLAAIGLLALPSFAAAGKVVTVKTAQVGSPGNPFVGIVPFYDGIYQGCSDAPVMKQGCQMVGGVDYPYGIGELEVTVKQYVDFLNAADPTGSDPHNLYASTESSSSWPRFGQINESPQARRGHHYTVAYPEWADKPYGFANFLRAARFVNSLYNGSLLSKSASSENGFHYVTYRVRLSPDTERGMYDLARNKRTGATRAHKTGFVIPSQDEWIKAAYYDPSGGGTFSYWKYPTNPGVPGEGESDAPAQSTLDSSTGNVSSTTQPQAIFHASEDVPAPAWCPPEQSADNCTDVNPLGLDPTQYAKAYAGSLGSVGQAGTFSPWGTLDQGGNAVEWTDTITPPPFGIKGGPRVWRRLHGGISNAPAYQLWISAIGLQPQDNVFYTATYPWLGFRVGVVGNLAPQR